MTTDTESCAAFQIAHMELDRVSVAAAGSKRQCDMQHAHMHVDIRQPTAKSDGEPPAAGISGPGHVYPLNYELLARIQHDMTISCPSQTQWSSTCHGWLPMTPASQHLAAHSIEGAGCS